MPVEPIKEEKKKKVKRKLLRHYAMIGKRTLFRPEREEWEPPPPPPPAKPKPSPPSVEPTPPPPPPPLADPVLDGVIILSKTKRMALMRGSHREERTSTRESSSRSRRRGRRHSPTQPTRKSYKVIRDEAKFYHLGDEISEMIIEQILEEKVVLKRKSNGDKVEVPLRSKEKTAQQSATSVQKKPPTRTIRKRSPRSRSSRFRRRSFRQRTR